MSARSFTRASRAVLSSHSLVAIRRQLVLSSQLTLSSQVSFSAQPQPQPLTSSPSSSPTSTPPLPSSSRYPPNRIMSADEAKVVEAKASEEVAKAIVDKVLGYWFEGVKPGAANAQMRRWFAGDDKEISDLFKVPLEQVSSDPALRAYFLNDAQSTLALVILLDQFSRNIYRGDGKSFSNDKLAQEVC